jgi:acyl-CoA reductase-like NAD-dependent aldehyde dehydrogenase
MTVVGQRLTRDAFIGGEWHAARSGRRFASIDPSTGEHFADVAEGGADDIDAAVRSAAAAFPAWSARKPLDRGRVLLKLAERINAEAEMLAALETRDSGKPTASQSATSAAPPATLSTTAGWPTSCRARPSRWARTMCPTHATSPSAW